MGYAQSSAGNPRSAVSAVHISSLDFTNHDISREAICLVIPMELKPGPKNFVNLKLANIDVPPSVAQRATDQQKAPLPTETHSLTSGLGAQIVGLKVRN